MNEACNKMIVCIERFNPKGYLNKIPGRTHINNETVKSEINFTIVFISVARCKRKSVPAQILLVNSL